MLFTIRPTAPVSNVGPFKCFVLICTVFLPLVKKLLQTKIKVNIVTGQHDFITSTAGTVKWVEKIVNSVWDPVSHDGKKRGKITIKQRLEGYFMKHERLTLYTVLRGGHSFLFENRPAMEWILKKILKEELSSDNK